MLSKTSLPALSRRCLSISPSAKEASEALKHVQEREKKLKTLINATSTFVKEATEALKHVQQREKELRAELRQVQATDMKLKALISDRSEVSIALNL